MPDSNNYDEINDIEDKDNNQSPQEKSEKNNKSIWWLIVGISCMILDVLLGHSMNNYFVSNHFGVSFFVGLGFLIYYLK